MKGSGRILLFALSVFLLSCGSGAQNAPAASAESGAHLRIINGDVVNQEDYPWIVKVISKVGEDLYNGCTGTVIGERAVITAAHCVTNVEAVYVQTGANDGPAVKGDSIHIARGYIALPIIGVYNDMAVVITGQPIGRPSLPIISSALPEKGEEVLLAGFGLEDADGGEYGTLRVGRTSIHDVTYLHLITEFDGSNSNVCFGDSGGPLIQMVKDGSGRLVGMGIAGIVSSGTSAKCAEGDLAFYTVIQRYIDGILKIVPEAQLL